MVFVDGRVSRFRIADAGGVMRDLSAYVSEVRGLPGERALDDVTALGDDGARFNLSDEAVAFSLRGIYDDTANTGTDAVLGALRYHAAPTAFEYAPAGLAAGNPKYIGVCWVRSYEIHSRAGAPVSWQAMLQVEGATARIGGA